MRAVTHDSSRPFPPWFYTICSAVHEWSGAWRVVSSPTQTSRKCVHGRRSVASLVKRPKTIGGSRIRRRGFTRSLRFQQKRPKIQTSRVEREGFAGRGRLCASCCKCHVARTPQLAAASAVRYLLDQNMVRRKTLGRSCEHTEVILFGR